MGSIVRTPIARSFMGRAWATELVEPGLIAAPVHYMVMPLRTVARIDDLSEHEERECWDLAFSCAESGLKKEGISSMGIFINDGQLAGQTVGHMHIHVFGLRSDAQNMNFDIELKTLSRKFRDYTLPVAEAFFQDQRSYAIQKMRAFRRNVLDHIPDCGFSIRTTNPFKSSKHISFTVEIWDGSHVRAHGQTNLLRVLNGLRDKPYHWPAANLDRGFSMKFGGV